MSHFWAADTAETPSSRAESLGDASGGGVRGLASSLLGRPAAVLTLALGMGANSAIFSVVDTVLLRPLPMPEAERLVHVYSVLRGRNGDTSVLDFRDMREKSRSFKELAAADSTELSLTGAGGEPERLQGTTVSAEFFQVLGTSPLVGRTFLPGEDAPGHSRVVVLGHALWQRRFGGDPAVLGRSVEVDGVPYTVVGVMRPGFDFPSRSQLWIPVTWEGDLIAPFNRGSHWLEVYGRLAPGVTVELDPGFRSEHVLTMDLSLPEREAYASSASREDFYDSLLERVRSLPGVQAVAATYHLPLALLARRGSPGPYRAARHELRQRGHGRAGGGRGGQRPPPGNREGAPPRGVRAPSAGFSQRHEPRGAHRGRTARAGPFRARRGAGVGQAPARGIRMALGADARSVLRLVIGQYLQLTVVGVALGLVLAFVASRLLAGLLYSVQAADPWAYAGVTVLLVGVALVASFLPAYRATRIDPVIALRHD